MAIALAGTAPSDPQATRNKNHNSSFFEEAGSAFAHLAASSIAIPERPGAEKFLLTLLR
jgi:hypothetical protein